MRDLYLIDIIKKAIFIFLILLTVFSCKTVIEKAAEETKETEEIRVLLKLSDKLSIQLSKHIIVENGLTSEKFEYKRNIKNINIDLTNDKVFLDGKHLEHPLNIYSKDERLITINDRKYLGRIKIDPSINSKIINYVPLDTYLMSVIPSEVPLSFDIEAIKAQAIVARTYAYRFIKRNAKRYDFDVDNTTRYQAYNGYTFFINPMIVNKLKKAVIETKGKIVVYDDKPILAYWRERSNKSFKTNIFQGGTIRFNDVPMGCLELASEFSRKCKFNDVGLDMMRVDGKWYIIEANMKYGRKGLELR